MKAIYFILGSITLLLGTIGIFLPLLPTTPFLLVTAFCYARSSDKLHKWLLSHKHFGPYIKSFLIDKTMTKKDKTRTLILLWITISISISYAPMVLVKISLFLIASLVSFYILKLNSPN
jgi:uncharacterized membrane protein YbaN (DUF454 family)